MHQESLVFLILHLVTIAPALVLGAIQLARPRGDRRHRMLGRIWVSLMIVSCLLSFGIRANGHFSWLHGLSAFTLFTVGTGFVAIRKGDLRTHRRMMTGSYIGMLIAFLFTFLEGRVLGEWVRSFLG